MGVACYLKTLFVSNNLYWSKINERREFLNKNYLLRFLYGVLTFSNQIGQMKKFVYFLGVFNPMLVTLSKLNKIFDLPQYTMNTATILGDDVTVGVSYLEVKGLM